MRGTDAVCAHGRAHLRACVRAWARTDIYSHALVCELDGKPDVYSLSFQCHLVVWFGELLGCACEARCVGASRMVSARSV